MAKEDYWFLLVNKGERLQDDLSWIFRKYFWTNRNVGEKIFVICDEEDTDVVPLKFEAHGVKGDQSIVDSWVSLREFMAIDLEAYLKIQWFASKDLREEVKKLAQFLASMPEKEYCFEIRSLSSRKYLEVVDDSQIVADDADLDDFFEK